MSPVKAAVSVSVDAQLFLSGIFLFNEKGTEYGRQKRIHAGHIHT